MNIFLNQKITQNCPARYFVNILLGGETAPCQSWVLLHLFNYLYSTYAMFLFRCQVMSDSLWPHGLQSVYAIYDLFAKSALSMPITNSHRKVIIKSERLKGWFFYERERYPPGPAIYSLWHLCSTKTQRKKCSPKIHMILTLRFCHLLAGWLQARHSAALSLSFLVQIMAW